MIKQIKCYKLPSSGPIDWSDKSKWEIIPKPMDKRVPPKNWVLRANETIKRMGYKSQSKIAEKMWNKMVASAEASLKNSIK